MASLPLLTASTFPGTEGSESVSPPAAGRTRQSADSDGCDAVVTSPSEPVRNVPVRV